MRCREEKLNPITARWIRSFVQDSSFSLELKCILRGKQFSVRAVIWRNILAIKNHEEHFGSGWALVLSWLRSQHMVQ